MPYTITPSDDGSYITLKFKGEINRKIAMEPNIKAHAMGREMGINRYLVDVTEAVNTDTMIDNYEFSTSDMRRTKGIDINARVATLISKDDHSHDFIEETAKRTGINMRLFTDIEQALNYLLHG